MIRNCWVSGGVTALAMLATLSLGLPLRGLTLAIVFCASLIIYGVDDLWDARCEPRRGRRAPPRAILAALALLLALLLSRVPGSVRWLVFTGALLSCGYGMPLPGRHRLKNVPGLKSLFVATAVTTAVIAVPLCVEVTLGGDPRSSLTALWPLATTLLLFTFSNSVAFDLRDLERDRLSANRTLPLRLGRRRTLSTLSLLNLAAIGGWTALGYWQLTPVRVEFIAASALTLGYLGLLGEHSPSRVYDWAVDGSLYLLLLITIGLPH